MGELLGCVKSIEAMCQQEQILDIQVKTTLTDLMAAILAVRNSSSGMITLTDIMKQTLVSGVMQVKSVVCTKAFKFYETHDFEDTPENILIFRDIVETYAEAGGRL